MNKFDISIIIIFFLILTTLIFLKFKNILHDDTIDHQIDNILNNSTNKQDVCNNISQPKENFTVSDAQDFHNYSALKNMVKKQPDNFDEERMINPPDDIKVDYNKEKDNNEFSIMVVNGEPKKVNETKHEKSFITAVDFGWDAPFPAVSCSNGSIDERFKSGPKKLLPYQISCGYSNKITAENYFKTKFMAQAIPLEDYVVRGANYAEYGKYTHPTKLNVRLLSQNTKGLPPEETKYRNIPSGENYAFPNSPAQRMG